MIRSRSLPVQSVFNFQMPEGDQHLLKAWVQLLMIGPSMAESGQSPGSCVCIWREDGCSIAMDPHSFFNAQVWDLRSQNLSIKDIADQANLDPKVILQRFSFDGFNQYTVTESELEEAGLEWGDAQEFGIEVVSGTDA